MFPFWNELTWSSGERHAVTIENINCRKDDHVEGQLTEAPDSGQYIKKYSVEKN